MSKKGFTLIELLIVIVIIGILSVAVVPRIMDYPKKARDATRKQTIEALNVAMQSYLMDYPTTALLSSIGCLIEGSGFGAELKNYLPNKVLPKDTASPKTYNGAACDYYYAVVKVASNKITDYAFVAAMESSAGNVSITTWTETSILGLTPGNTGTHYLTKQTGL